LVGRFSSGVDEAAGAVDCGVEDDPHPERSDITKIKVNRRSENLIVEKPLLVEKPRWRMVPASGASVIVAIKQGSPSKN
jgi:hypothetical protein